MSRLQAALDPKSVAVIGASDNPNKVGGRPVHYLDKFGFKGKIYPINPSRPEIQGHKSYASLADLPEAPEMAIVAVAGDNAIGAVEDCAARGVKIAVVMASGFGEVDPIDGKAKERRMVEVAHGPACGSSVPTRRASPISAPARSRPSRPCSPNSIAQRATSRCSASPARCRRCRSASCGRRASACATATPPATTPTSPSANWPARSPRIPKSS